MKLNKNQLGGLLVKILLGGLLAILIGSFVLSDMTRTAGGSYDKLHHRGVDLTNARDTRDAAQLASLLALNEGQAIPPAQFVNAARVEAMNRAAKRTEENNPVFRFFVGVVERLHVADELGVPAPDRPRLEEFIKNNPLFANQTGAFDPAQLKMITDIARERLELSNTDLDRALANAWRIQKVATVASPATPPALDVLARRISEKARTEWKVERAVLNRAGYKADVKPDAQADEEFFKAAPEAYRIPEMSRVRIVKHPGDLKAADAVPTPTEKDLTELAARHSKKFPLLAFTEPAKFIAENRAELMKTWREEKAGEDAADKLSKLLLTHVPPGDSRPDDAKVDAMLKAAGLDAKTIPAYGADRLPTGTDIPDDVLREALNYNATRWRSGALPYGANAYVIVFDSAIPSRLPAFAEVKNRVAADRAAVETDKLFAKAAETKAAEIAKAVKDGKKFADAAKAAGLSVVPVATFELQNAPDELREQIESLETLPVGGVSGAFRQGPDRAVAHIVARKAPAAAKEDPLAARIEQFIGAEAARATATTITTDR